MTFQQRILERYSLHKRALPRRDSFDPYLVLVSETMLQQTQVDRVIPKFNQFIKSFPDFAALAEAPKELLLSHRSGLGFNSRAIRLQACAAQLLHEHGGVLPKERTILMELPGIGPYTSCALLAFVYNLPVPVVDTNIRRVLLHELTLPEDISLKELEEYAEKAIPEGRSNDRHNALMDYGSLVLTSKKTGIKPTSKQSRFKGSRREVRGNIVKHLLKHGPTATTVLEKTYRHDDFDRIVDGMIHEGLIKNKQSILSFE